MNERSIFVARITAMAVAVFFCVVALLPLLARAQIPAGAEKYKRDLIRQARLEWGLTAPVSMIAAQIETESNFNPLAQSPVGAIGLAQFMPATSAWISGAYAHLAENAPTNPLWALRAVATYDRILWDNAFVAATDCDRAAFMLSAYNGGERARDNEVALCVKDGKCDPTRWWGNIENYRWRAPQFFRENRNYPRLILRLREPRYIKAGWGPGLCN